MQLVAIRFEVTSNKGATKSQRCCFANEVILWTNDVEAMPQMKLNCVQTKLPTANSLVAHNSKKSATEVAEIFTL